MPMLAFFPWLVIKESVEVSDVKLVPFNKNKLTEEFNINSQNAIDRVLKPYVNRDDRSIDRATLVFLKNKKLLEDYNEDEREYLFSISEILAFSGLSKREYFGLTYWNFTNFFFVIQAFAQNSSSVVVVSRRRDGSTTNLVSGSTYKERMPYNISFNYPVSLDIVLIDAFLKAQRQLGDEWLEYFDAIFNFNRANTDDYKIPEHQEAVMTIGALQRILDSGHREDDLITKFMALFKSSEDFDVNKSSKVKGTKYKNGNMTLREIWLRDFNQLRGDFAHGKRTSKKSCLWKSHEHLLLGSYIFPLIVKCRLQKDGFYQLTPDDVFDINVFERLAEADLFKKPDDQRNSIDWEWNRIRSHEKTKAVVSEVLKEFQDFNK